MNFKEWINLNERSFYHGTVIDNLPLIRSIGLVPGVGDFVQDAYGSDYDEAGIDLGDEDNLPDGMEPGIFFADRESAAASITAMRHHIAKKLGKSFYDVNKLDIINHGLLLKVKDDSSITKYDSYRNIPPVIGAEEGDHVSTNRVRPDQYITGQAIIRLMRRLGYGREPRRYWDNRTKQPYRPYENK